MKKYLPREVELKWQKIWEDAGIYSPALDRAQNPFYNLMMFPYPSAEGLHVGNMYAFTGSDIYGRFQRMQGFNVFEPIGLDGFGIHSENYALKVGRHPREQAKISEKNFYRQLRAIGNAYDWTRKLETYDWHYYKWTQWIFIQLFKAGLAYRAKAPVNFCPQDKTVLADEQVVDGRCERCGTVVEKQDLEQWFFKITAYADRLLANIEKLDWSLSVKIAQRQWIGRKEGIDIAYKIEGGDETVVCFTTRPDTNFGATFIVIGPEHPLIYKITQKRYLDAVKKYAQAALKKSYQERIEEGRKKTGVFTGSYAINNLNGKKLPIWVSDFVLGNVGTGAVVGVPGHDKRDFEFAQVMKLPVVRVVVGADGDRGKISRVEQVQEEEGTMVNSEFLDGRDIQAATKVITNYLEKKGWGKRVTTYHLRDWLISRQRYWGPPIPMINCEKCGWQPVSEQDLPVLLPDVADWKPKGTGESPLASVASFVKTTCPNCGGEARRETDVSDTFLDSAWYFLRYLATEIADRAWDRKRANKWLPVDMYIGGAEHSVLHLLYTRFLSMVFYDLGLVNFSAKGGLAEEPFAKFRAHGLLIAAGAKMSKSRGNVVVPDAYIDKYGADTLRCYLMFCGRFTQGGDFRDTGIAGMHKFLKRVWRLVSRSVGQWDGRKEEKKEPTSPQTHQPTDLYMMHKTIKKVTEDISDLSYNTAISALMIWLNALEERLGSTGPTTSFPPASARSDLKTDGVKIDRADLRAVGRLASLRATGVTRLELEIFLKLLAPFAPHVTEELWQMLGEKSSIHQAPWPKYDRKLVRAKKVTLVVQVNGKLRDKLLVEAGISQEQAQKLALASERVQKYLGGKKPQKAIYVADRLINFVV